MTMSFNVFTIFREKFCALHVRRDAAAGRACPWRLRVTPLSGCLFPIRRLHMHVTQACTPPHASGRRCGRTQKGSPCTAAAPPMMVRVC